MFHANSNETAEAAILLSDRVGLTHRLLGDETKKDTVCQLKGQFIKKIQQLQADLGDTVLVLDHCNKVNEFLVSQWM